MTRCPTCRGNITYCTNTLVGQISELLPHKCRFSSFGCMVKMKIDEIQKHEENCDEKTIVCASREIYKQRCH